MSFRFRTPSAEERKIAAEPKLPSCCKSERSSGLVASDEVKGSRGAKQGPQPRAPTCKKRRRRQHRDGAAEAANRREILLISRT